MASGVTLANLAAAALSSYPARVQHFGLREKQLASIVKVYVDAQISASDDLVEDLTPQLGGNLDVNGKSIVSVSDGDITVTPHGTGDVILDGLKHPQADGNANELMVTDGSAQLSFTKIADANVDASAAVATSKLAGATHSADAVALLPKFAKANFVFSDQPASGTFACFGSTDIPDNAIIVGGFVDVITTFAGTGDDDNTIAIQVNGANDIVTATAINAATDWDEGLQDIIPDPSDGTSFIKLTAARDISVVVVDGAGVLSAGEMNIYLQYIEGV